MWHVTCRMRYRGQRSESQCKLACKSAKHVAIWYQRGQNTFDYNIMMTKRKMYVTEEKEKMKYDLQVLLTVKEKMPLQWISFQICLGRGKNRSKRRAGLHSDVGCGHEFSGTPEDHRSDH